MNTRIEYTKDKLCHWAGMGDYELISPDGKYILQIPYEGEPPHGDSYHRVVINERVLGFHAWGGMFTFSACSRYFGFSAMPEKWQRKTCVLDLEKSLYFFLPNYLYEFGFAWPLLVGTGDTSAGQSFGFTGTEAWAAY